MRAGLLSWRCASENRAKTVQRIGNIRRAAIAIALLADKVATEVSSGKSSANPNLSQKLLTVAVWPEMSL